MVILAPENTSKLKIKQFFSNAHIGMRKWKSIFAIGISFFVWQLIRIPFPDLEVHPIYMYIYSLLEIRDSSQKTVDFSRRRLKANLCAFLVGLPLLAIMDLLKNLAPEGWACHLIELIFILFGTILTITIAQLMGCKTFCGIAAVIFIILLASHSNDGRYIYCLLRAFQTVAAVFIAWLLNVKLFPYPGKDEQVEKNDTKNEQTNFNSRA